MAQYKVTYEYLRQSDNGFTITDSAVDYVEGESAVYVNDNFEIRNLAGRVVAFYPRVRVVSVKRLA